MQKDYRWSVDLAETAVANRLTFKGERLGEFQEARASADMYVVSVWSKSPATR